MSKLSLFKNIAPYILLFIVIYISDDTFLFGTAEGGLFSKVKYMLYYMLPIPLIINVRFVSKSDAILIAFLIILIAITSISNFDFRGGYVYQVLVLILSFLIAKKISFQVFAKLFCQFMYIFGIISLIVFAVALLFPSILTFFPVVTNISGLESHNLFLAIVNIDEGHGVRNTGVFREPGVYMIYLNIALMISLFYSKSINKKYVIIFILCIISTLSTAGVVVTGGVLLSALFGGKNVFSKNEKRLIYLIPILLVAFIVYNEGISDLVFGKLNKDSGKYVSTLSRIASLHIPLVNFMDYPIVGSGLSQFNFDFERQAMLLYGIPLKADGTATNTITNKFATYGFTFGAIFMYGLFRFTKKVLSRRLIITFFLFVLMLAMFSNEDMRYSLFFNILFFYGFLTANTNPNAYTNIINKNG
ncbi:hypothetical protein [Marinifilum fragile]|uniref:hypothetical protein n=1 Tax=Marinifilum fragile TaxID=570161 RepID=UPI002AAC0C19|nr:hypothetical protein [Marinifilum fragile]